MDKLRDLVTDFQSRYKFNNPNVLLDVIQNLQTVIDFAFEIELQSKQYKPKLMLGETKEDEQSNKTLVYENPIVFITLKRRAYSGSLGKSTHELFQGNIASAVPKFEKKVYLDKNNEENFIYKSVIQTDNEILLRLKTKTIKEQLILINILERSLNVYCRKILSNFISFCAIKEIESESTQDKDEMYTTNILFQLRLNEELEVDDTYLLKAFSVYSGEYMYDNNK
ncbi:hypothetical protein [Cetobacterium sp.]|uniref:hypothetical protein n=1 Tax=Cetobacterium sp. TaxID=2071632 RepID=UPI003F2AC4EE